MPENEDRIKKLTDRKGLTVIEGGGSRRPGEPIDSETLLFVPTNTEKPSDEDVAQELRTELNMLVEGKFSELREEVRKRGIPEEAQHMLNLVGTLYRRYWQEERPTTHPMPPMNNAARIFLDSERGSLEYFTALFAILREAGFAAKDKGEFRRGFANNESDSTVIRAMLALESSFPD